MPSRAEVTLGSFNLIAKFNPINDILDFEYEW